MYSFKGWQNNKNHAFTSKCCKSNEKSVIFAHFTMKIIRTYLYITCNKMLSKNILAYGGYSPSSPYFLLLSEHKRCYNTATHSNSEYARNRIVTSLLGSVGTGTRKNESSTGRVWAAGFYHVMARSRSARVLKLMNRLCFLIFQFFFGPR